MTTVQLFTDLTQNGLSASDELLATELRSRGVSVVAQPWETHNEAADVGIIRSTWNYPEQLDTFKQWLHTSEQLCSKHFNPTALVLWNLDKSYLVDLRSMGIKTVPTHLINSVTDHEWETITSLFGEDVVVKPRVGNSGREISRVRSKDAFIQHTKDNFLVQPYLPELSATEVSFIFIGNTFSHAIQRIPSRSDFRANVALGATVAIYEPTSNQIATAGVVLNHLPEDPLYARIDGYFDNDGFILNEIELVEPGLFFKEGTSSGAAERFADHLVASL